MDDQIVSRAHIRRKGYNAALRGDDAESHNMNHGAVALGDWLAGYCFGLADVVRASAPQSHTAPAGRERVDAHQGGASC